MLKLKSLIQTLSLTLLLSAILAAPTHAAMIGTHELLSVPAPSAGFDEQRRAIEQQLVELGVAPLQARQRAAALSDAQVADISERLHNLPAGADAGGVILTIFIVFVITDVIGATDIFPFIKPVR